MDDQAPQPPYLQDGPSYWSIHYIRAPREVVFDYLTIGEHTSRYYYGMPINDPRQVGQAIWFGPTEEASPIRGKVLAFDRPSRFSHTFAFGHRDDEPSVVDFVLDQAGPAITKLTLHHHGFDGRTGTYIDVAEGWPAILASLKSLLETGEPRTGRSPRATTCDPSAPGVSLGRFVPSARPCRIAARPAVRHLSGGTYTSQDLLSQCAKEQPNATATGVCTAERLPRTSSRDHRKGRTRSRRAPRAW